MFFITILLGLSLNTSELSEKIEVSRVHLDSEWRVKRELAFYTPSKTMLA